MAFGNQEVRVWACLSSGGFGESNKSSNIIVAIHESDYI